MGDIIHQGGHYSLVNNVRGDNFWGGQYSLLHRNRQRLEAPIGGAMGLKASSPVVPLIWLLFNSIKYSFGQHSITAVEALRAISLFQLAISLWRCVRYYDT